MKNVLSIQNQFISIKTTWFYLQVNKSHIIFQIFNTINTLNTPNIIFTHTKESKLALCIYCILKGREYCELDTEILCFWASLLTSGEECDRNHSPSEVVFINIHQYPLLALASSFFPNCACLSTWNISCSRVNDLRSM